MPKAYSDKALVFDTGSIISLSLNNLLWILPELKKKFNGRFILSKDVRRELIEKPLLIKRFKLEAFNILRYINDGTLEVAANNAKKEGTRILELCNNIFRADTYIKMIDLAEIESLMLACKLNGTYVVDERTMRMLAEDINGLHELLEKKLHRQVFINKENLEEFKILTKNVRIIRSSELGYVAYTLGLFKEYEKKINRKEVLDGILWGLKLKGCAISQEEIDRLEGYDSKK